MNDDQKKVVTYIIAGAVLLVGLSIYALASKNSSLTKSLALAEAQVTSLKKEAAETESKHLAETKSLRQQLSEQKDYYEERFADGHVVIRQSSKTSASLEQLSQVKLEYEKKVTELTLSVDTKDRRIQELEHKVTTSGNRYGAGVDYGLMDTTLRVKLDALVGPVLVTVSNPPAAVFEPRVGASLMF